MARVLEQRHAPIFIAHDQIQIAIFVIIQESCMGRVTTICQAILFCRFGESIRYAGNGQSFGNPVCALRTRFMCAGQVRR